MLAHRVGNVEIYLGRLSVLHSVPYITWEY